MHEQILRTLERLIPRRIYHFFQPSYHFLLAFSGALLYRFPSRNIVVIFVTGTKGKTSTTEILNAILEAAGKKTAVLGTLRFKIGEKNERNMKKMTIPGRFFVQKFLRDAVDAKCTHAIIEMTSEGAKQSRHRFIDADALIFTNLAPEHIESHGSYEKYRDAKLSIAQALAHSSKKTHFMVANSDDKEGAKFLAVSGVTPLPYSLRDAEGLVADDTHISFHWHGANCTSSLPGKFNAYNILAAATLAEAMGVEKSAIAKGIQSQSGIEGRMERVEWGQKFPVIVDYAHTPDSLLAVYETFPHHNKICILGNTGGGRDTWKRPVMGKIADEHCTHIILTNEDPYDEDPLSILEEMKKGILKVKPEIILDRKTAIERGVAMAWKTPDAALLITGKGTDPFIMGPNGTKLEWDDRRVAREELEKALHA